MAMDVVAVASVPMVMPGMAVAVPVVVIVAVLAPAQEPNAGDVHDQAEHRNRDRLGEVDGHGGEQA